MLSLHCFSRHWIDRHSAAMNCRNPIMLEKAIAALQLLGHLAESGFPFQFKGGTSLLLRLPTIQRLSIDVDIVTQVDRAALEVALAHVGGKYPFSRYEHDPRRDAALPPKSHYKLHYQSVIEPKPDHILLDVLFEQNLTAHAEAVQINASFIEPSRQVFVSIPRIDALLGDKLTAFAPNTIGVPYFDRVGESRRTDVIKQLFDSAALFDAAGDLNLTAEIYSALHARQCHYRQQTFTLAQSLDDSIETGMLLAAHDLRGFGNTPQSQDLLDGVNSLQNHLVNAQFRHPQARCAAGKVACAAAWLKHRPANTPVGALRFAPTMAATHGVKSIGEPWKPLNRIKATNPEAFHYWWHAWQINFGTRP